MRGKPHRRAIDALEADVEARQPDSPGDGSGPGNCRQPPGARATGSVHQHQQAAEGARAPERHHGQAMA